MGSLISVMLIFPRRPCLSFLMKPRFKFPVIIPCRAYASCTFQQGFAKRVGISHPDECSQCGLTASWNLRRPTEKCAEFQLGVRFSSAGTHFSEMASRPCRGGRQVVFGDVEPNQSAREMVNGLVAGGGALARRISSRRLRTSWPKKVDLKSLSAQVSV